MFRLSKDYIERFFVISDKVFCLCIDMEDRMILLDEVDTDFKNMGDFEISLKPKSFHFSNVIYTCNLGESEEAKENARNLMIRTYILLAKNVLRAKFGNGVAIGTFEYYEDALGEAIDNERAMKKIEQKKVEEEKKEINEEEYLKNIILDDDVKERVLSVIRFFKYREQYEEIGATTPRGVLLVGNPGCGKSYLGEIISEILSVEYKYMASSELASKYVGSSAEKTRELFESFDKKKGAILFLDEIDAIASKREGDENKEYRSLLNQLLASMSDKKYKNIIVFAATNRISDLDSAITRRGRFDYIIEIDEPDFDMRIELFKLYLNRVKHENDINCYELAELTDGRVGADIASVVNAAAIRAVNEGFKTVHIDHLLKEIDLLNKDEEVKKQTKKESRKIGFN